MSTNTESNKYTIFFAIGMVVIVGSLLAFTASSLKPNIKENERMEKQQNILYAMGVNDNGDNDIVFVGTDKVASEFSKYISKQLVLDTSGNAVENNEAYLIDVKKEQAKAKNGQTRDLPLLLERKMDKHFTLHPFEEKDCGMPYGGILQWIRIW
jgi:Na+-transporting NADH:ubiquinone oxidoreductase subunit C